MSNIIQAQCWPLQMPPTPKSVLISLADNANDLGECWPSLPTIAMRTCFSERAIRNAIEWLADHGLLIADRASGRSTRYIVTPDRYRPPADMVAVEDATPAADAGVSDREPRHEVPESGASTPARGAATPAGGAAPPRHEMPEPRHEVPPNHKEPSLEPSRNHKARSTDAQTLVLLASLGVDEQVAKDWLAMRKKRRAVTTQTVLDHICRQAEKAGMTLCDVLRLMVVRNWQGFQAEWMLPAHGVQRVGGQTVTKDEGRAIAARTLFGRRGGDEPYTIDQ